MIVEKVWLFWTMDYNEWSSKLIAKMTDGPWSHVGIGFTSDNGKEFFYEAHVKHGFHGPNTMYSLELRNISHKRTMCKVYLSYPKEAAQAMHKEADRWVKSDDHNSYNTIQLIWMALNERYGIPVPRSPKRMVCSEAVAKLLRFPNSLQMNGVQVMDLRDKTRPIDDEVTPNSAWARYCEIRCGLGKYTAVMGD